MSLQLLKLEFIDQFSIEFIFLLAKTHSRVYSIWKKKKIWCLWGKSGLTSSWLPSMFMCYRSYEIITWSFSLYQAFLSPIALLISIEMFPFLCVFLFYHFQFIFATGNWMKCRVNLMKRKWAWKGKFPASTNLHEANFVIRPEGHFRLNSSEDVFISRSLKQILCNSPKHFSQSFMSRNNQGRIKWALVVINYLKLKLKLKCDWNTVHAFYFISELSVVNYINLINLHQRLPRSVTREAFDELREGEVCAFGSFAMFGCHRPASRRSRGGLQRREFLERRDTRWNCCWLRFGRAAELRLRTGEARRLCWCHHSCIWEDFAKHPWVPEVIRGMARPALASSRLWETGPSCSCKPSDRMSETSSPTSQQWFALGRFLN